MFKMGLKFNFSIFYEEHLDAAMWLTLPLGYRIGSQKIRLFYP
jgi:hypothetical protein